MSRPTPSRRVKPRARFHRPIPTLGFEILEDRTTPTANAASLLESLGLTIGDVEASHYSTMTWQSQEAIVRSGEWIARFSLSPDAITPGQQIEEIGALLADLEGEVTVSRYLGTTGLVLLKTSSTMTVEVLAASLAPISSLAYFEPNFVLWGTATFPNDPFFGSQWWLHSASDADIDAPEAWDVVTGSGNVVVGVIDTGVNYLHPDLIANIWINPGEIPGDGIDNDMNGYIDDVYGYDFANNDSDPMDDDGHGTSVAGIIAATGNNGLGVTGVNWNAQIMILKYLNENRVGNTADAIEAVNYATMMRQMYGVNVRVLNNSYAIAGDSIAFREAIAASGEAGILFVASAGNNSSNNDYGAVYPANFDLPSVLSVAATTSADVLAGFSNYGPNSVHVAAPGASVFTTSVTGGYTNFSGTSAAAPVVAGIAALLWDAAPYASLEQIRDAILGGVDRLQSLEEMLITEGRVNVANSLNLLGLRVTEVSPDAGEVVTNPPLDFTVVVSSPYDPSTVDAEDLRVNGIAADGFTLTDAQTITFHFQNSPVIQEGIQTLSMATGAILRDGDGAALLGLETTFRHDALILAVTESHPANGSVATVPVSILRLEFNEDVDTSSVGINDLWLSEGSIVGFTIVNPRVIEYSVTGVRREGAVIYGLPAGVLRDMHGNGNAGFLGEFVLDVDEVAVEEFQRVEPLGSFIFASTDNRGFIQWTGDADTFLVAMSAGESITAIVRANDPNVSISVELVGLGVMASGGAGEAVTLSPTKVAEAGQYKLRITASSPTEYTFDVWKNAVLEATDSSDPTSLDVTRLEIGSGRYGAIGVIETEAGGSAASMTIYSADMSVHPGWTFTGGWAYGNPTGLNGDPVGGYTGPSVVGYVINGRYPNNIATTYYATTQAIDASGFQDVTLSFRRRLGIENSIYDQANIQASNDGINWTTIWQHSGVTINELAWSLQTYDISAIADNQSTVYIRWGLGPTDFTVNYGGWNIDDVVVTGRPNDPDVDLYSIDFTGRVGTTVDIVLKGLDGVSQANAILELLGPDGVTVIATSGAGGFATNVDQALLGVAIPDDGVYIVRVSSNMDGRYSLAVTEGISFEIETNDADPAAASSFEQTWSVLGHVGQPPVAGIYDFVIDSTETRITVSGHVFTADGFINSPFTPQASGSLRANIEGGISLFVSDEGIRILDAVLDPIEKPGPFLPFNEPADFAARTTIFGQNIYAKLSNIQARSFSDLLTLDANGQFDATQVTFELFNGSIQFSAFGNSGSLPVATPDTGNPATSPGTFEILPGLLRLVVPFRMVFDIPEPTTGILVHLEMTGNIIATAAIPIIDDDIHAITLTAGQHYEITANPIGADSPANTLVPRLFLMGPDGAILAENAGLAGTGASLSLMAPETGTYRIIVRSDSGHGDYVLKARSVLAVETAGHHQIAEGESLYLRAQAVFAEESSELTFHWDLNGDGEYDDAIGHGVQLTWSELAAFGINDDGAYGIKVRVTDGAGRAAEAASILIVTNASPAASISGPLRVVRGQETTYTLLASDPSSADQAAGFRFHIDWNGDGVVDQIIEGPSGTQVVHVFESDLENEIHAISVWAEDKDGGTGSVAHFETTTQRLIRRKDFDDPNVQSLYLGGTTGNDVIAIIPQANGGILVWEIWLNGVFVNRSQIVYGVTGKVVVYGQSGDDTISATFLANHAVHLYGQGGDDILIGGAGNDRLDGGDGNDMLIGNAGNDLLLGGRGNDLLVGGMGRDTLVGGAGSDLLLTGHSPWFDNTAAMMQLRDEWRTASTLEERIHHLSGATGGLNEPYYLHGASLVNDDEVDEAFGESDDDWFLVDLLLDVVHDAEPGDVVAPL